MNQKVVIYIILSAILLYLYYKRGGIAIFAAFVVMVAGTLFASKREGFGFGGGGGDKGDKACAKLGFITPKIDKKDINGGLEKTLKNFKKVVEKYADVGERGIDIEKSGKEFKAIGDIKSAMDIQKKWEADTNNNLSEFFNISYRLFDPYIFRPSEEKQKEVVKDIPTLPKEAVKKIINGGNRIVKMLEDTKKLDEVKQLDKKAKTVLDVSICSFKQVVLIWKCLDKAIGGGDDKDDKDDKDDEEKPTKKKKKSTKKSKKDDEDADADADAEDE